MDISCALQFYFFQLGERNEMIQYLKNFMRSRAYLKIKPSQGMIFDTSLIASLKEFQRHHHLLITDGFFNEETYATLGKEMTSVQLKQISLTDGNRVLMWLLQGKPVNAVPFAVSHPQSLFEKSNGNPEDEATDRALAKLFTFNGIVRAASAVRGNPERSHFKLTDGKVYTMHIYGDENGLSTTGIYLPKFFQSPKYVAPDTVTATTSKGEIIGIAHVRVSSQAELNQNYNLGKVNLLGSRYIGETAGLNGDSVCYRHSHIHFYPNVTARSIIQRIKTGGDDPTIKDSKYLLDVRELLRK